MTFHGAYCLNRLNIGLLLLLLSSSSLSQIYKWEDENGNVHFGDKSLNGGADDAEAITVKDKYAVPVAEQLLVTAYSGSEKSRPITLSDVVLDLPHSNENDVLVGRVVCGQPVDLYWRNGYVRLDRSYVGRQFTEVLDQYGYQSRVGDYIRENGDLSLSIKVKTIFINTCSSTRRENLSKDSTFLKLEWNIYDPLKNQDVLNFETKGSHHGIQKKPIENGRQYSFSQAFTMAFTNGLANEDFIGLLNETVNTAGLLDSSPSLNLELNYSSGFGSFESSAEKLKERTVIVKTDEGHGSGVFIANGGYILTNAHVVGAEKTFIIEASERNFTASLVKLNTARDIALLKVEHSSMVPSPVPISKRPANIGEELYVIGTPLDTSFSHTITRGIVSAKRIMRGLEYIQTDAAINFGNSGGPVFNKKGELVAITVSSVMTRDGASLNINYLIPIDDAIKKLKLSDSAVTTDDAISSIVAQELEEFNRSFGQGNSFLDRLYQWLDKPLF